jgi:hypothetical protein
MSLYRDRRSPFWRFDFQYRGHRFYGRAKTHGSRSLLCSVVAWSLGPRWANQSTSCNPRLLLAGDGRGFVVKHGVISAVARVWVKPGAGNIVTNTRDVETRRRRRGESSRAAVVPVAAPSSRLDRALPN